MAQRLGTGLGLERGKKEETDERVLELARLAAIDSPLLGHSQPIHAVITQPSLRDSRSPGAPAVHSEPPP